MAEAGFRVGLRVDDVQAAAAFYGGLGFTEIGSVPDPQGQPVMTILERNGVQLIIDALRGMPFRDTERERQTQAGPRGLGVAVGLSVDDLDATFAYCTEAGCEITCELMEGPGAIASSSASIPTATSGSSRNRSGALPRPTAWKPSGRVGSAPKSDVTPVVAWATVELAHSRR
jgi:catechol 2,3-dioxygenase-like lactoylglutathione lyase family enzyme